MEQKLLFTFLQMIRCIVHSVRPYKKKILVLRHRRALKIPPDETFLSWEGKKIAAARQISHADKYNFLLIEQGFLYKQEVEMSVSVQRFTF